MLLYSWQDVRVNEWMIENDKDAQYPDSETEMMLKERSKKRLREMTFYSTATDCLRGFILKYFGESPPNYCGNCGSCNTNFDTVDITEDARQVLSCVAEMGERFGSRMVVDVLHGNVNDKTVRFGLTESPMFGANGKQVRQLREIVEFLVLHGYLFRTKDEFPIIKFGERADEVLRGGASVEMKLIKEKVPKEPRGIRKQTQFGFAGKAGRRAEKIGNSANKSVDGTIDSDLFETLRKLRRETANAQNVPAYVVFSDNTLVDMSIKTPKTREEFLDVSGVGEVKLERYGEKFLNAIAEYLANR
jgi:ATP-dependent DNA helicase RecQ